MSQKHLHIKGCRVNNLKNISVSIPRNKLVVITGLSGSGKSSLAFDTIYAEGQRRYVESLSSYARQFLDIKDKPDVDEITGLSPVIAIDQKSTITNPRSTIGTITEIYDLLRLLYVKVGTPHCPDCGAQIEKQTVDQITADIYKKLGGKKVTVLAPVVKNQKGSHKKIIENITKANFFQLRLDGEIYNIEEVRDIRIDKKEAHTIEVVLDSFTLEKTDKMQARLKELVAQAIDLSNGSVFIQNGGTDKDYIYNERVHCPHCDKSFPDIELRSFSFNSPYGACTTCTGLGKTLKLDEGMVIANPRLTIAQGAIRVWDKVFTNQKWAGALLEAVAKKNKFSLDTEAGKLSAKARTVLLYGTGDVAYTVNDKQMTFEGIIPMLEQKYKETDSEYLRNEIEKYMRVLVCPACEGKRLRPEVLAVTIKKYSISDITMESIETVLSVIGSLVKNGKKGDDVLNKKQQTIAAPIVVEIEKRLGYLESIGLGYLSLNRSAATLSGGEAQRIRLTTQLSSQLSEVIYVLDEPSIGLHARDNQKLLDTLLELKRLENTVIVVEHDADIIEQADYIIDVGPGAGEYGGEIIAAGTPDEIKKDSNSLTGAYLSDKKEIKKPAKYRKGNGKAIKITGASEFNLNNVSVDIPLGKLVCVTGVSGSGKSTLVHDILGKYLAQKFYRAKDVPGAHKDIKGVDYIDKVITIDQSPIGRTPRSNPATYTGVFTYIRDLYAQLPESKLKGFDAGRFSFNVKGGRCEECSGDGMMKIEMQFLPDVYVECDSCNGARYQKEVLEIFYKDKNIADVLEMTVKEACHFFDDVQVIKDKLQTLFEVGLGYVHLGQSATTLSGGEAQRVKLATELSRRSTGKTLYILDEPTTGLHFDDINRLLSILNKLVDKGNTVLIIEHNLGVIRSADWIIDLGPGGGDKGGNIVATGTPDDIIKEKKSLTGQYLKKD